MANGKRVDHKRLEKKITDVSKALANLNSADDLRKLILLIKKPGWTTPAEFIFALGVAETLLAQAKVVAATTDLLLKGSRAVSPRG
jgi:hypothetical protein